MSLRQEVEWFQNDMETLGEIYSRLNAVRNVLLDFAFKDWRDHGLTREDIPILSLEFISPKDPAGRWRGMFRPKGGPLGFTNVISLNLCGFHSAHEVPPTLAHEMAHWFDKPNTGHGETFWYIMRHRVGIDKNGMFLMPWMSMRDHFPDDLHDFQFDFGAREQDDLT